MYNVDLTKTVEESIQANIKEGGVLSNPKLAVIFRALISDYDSFLAQWGRKPPFSAIGPRYSRRVARHSGGALSVFLNRLNDEGVIAVVKTPKLMRTVLLWPEEIADIIGEEKDYFRVNEYLTNFEAEA